MHDVRLIDANALIKDITESIRLADEWEKESHEKKDKHGLKYAIDTRRSLMAMISRVMDAPTIEPEVKKPKTNGDRIRQMTDEELADWMTDGHDNCDLCQFGTCRPEFECEKGVLEWVKQEVSECGGTD